MNKIAEIQTINPKKAHFYRSSGGILQARIDDKEYNQIQLYRTFPLSHPWHYISVRNATDEEIGVIKDISELTHEGHIEVKKELHLRYFIPIVQRIISIKQEPDLWIWELETDRGPLTLIMRNLHEHLHHPSDGRLLISDMDGRRCEINNYNRLDAFSRKELNKIL